MSEAFRREALLEAIASIGLGEATPKTFLMPKSAKRILDPAVTVVLGARGSGKSSLAAALTSSGPDDDPFDRALVHDFDEAYRFDAFSQRSARHADPLVLDAFVRDANEERLRDYWLGYLIVQCLSQMKLMFRHASLGEEFGAYEKGSQIVRDDPGAAVELASDRKSSLEMLGHLDDAFVETSKTRPGFVSRSITAVYDDLDSVGAFDPELRARFIRALLAMWTTFSTRYRHLRAKIFLPADLFDLRLFDTLNVSKLMARAERIEWDVPSLYRLVLRHLSAQDDNARAWLSSVGVEFEEFGDHGFIPDPPSDAVLHRWLSKTLRAFVAVNGTRAPVERWIANRLRDGNDRIAPRSMLGFFRESAKLALRRPPSAHWNHLFSVEDAVAALVTVGKQRVDEVREVYRWVDRLEALRGRLVPMRRSELEVLLATDPPSVPAPTAPRDGKSVTTELLRLGMLRDLGVDDLIDVPDLIAGHLGVLRGPPELAVPTPPRS